MRSYIVYIQGWWVGKQKPYGSKMEKFDVVGRGGGERGNELLNRPAYFIYTKCILRLSLFFPPEVSSRLCIGNAE